MTVSVFSLSAAPVFDKVMHLEVGSYDNHFPVFILASDLHVRTIALELVNEIVKAVRATVDSYSSTMTITHVVAAATENYVLAFVALDAVKLHGFTPAASLGVLYP